jgi:hypothetical protein
MLLDNLLLIGIQTLLLIVFFETNFIYEYSKLFRIIKKIRIINEYEAYIYKNNFLKFSDFLSLKTNFIAKLFSCPLCLNFWLSLFSCILSNNMLLLGINYVLSIFTYLVISLLYGKYIRTHI